MEKYSRCWRQVNQQQLKDVGFSSNEEQYASNEDVEWKKIVLNFDEYEPRTLLPCRANLMAELHPTSEGQLAPATIISLSQYSCVDFIISSDL